FSCHIPYPRVDISKFSTFFSFPRHISRPNFFRHIPCPTFSCHIPRPSVEISKFSTFFSFTRHISRPNVSRHIPDPR
ncbi:hypothetical protein T4D_447, partial [Trichinella pseudospiralis]